MDQSEGTSKNYFIVSVYDLMRCIYYYYVCVRVHACWCVLCVRVGSGCVCGWAAYTRVCMGLYVCVCVCIVHISIR